MSIFKRLFKKSRSIYDCCNVVCKLQYLFGCSGIRRGNDNLIMDFKSLAYTLLTALLVVAALLGLALVKFQDPYLVEMDRLIKSIIYLELGVSLFMYLTTVVTMVANAKPHMELYKRLNDLDRVLIKEFHCNMKYDVLLKKHVLLILAIASIYSMIVILAVTRASTVLESLTNLMAGIAYTFVTAGPHLNGYAQMNVAEILRIRFRLLQKLLLKKFVRSPARGVDRQFERLQRLIDVVQEYNDCIGISNKVFSLSMLSTMFHDFTLTTSELYLIFGGSATADNSALIYFVVLGLVLPFYKMTIAPMYSENAIQEVEHCFKIIKDLDLLYPGNKKVRQMVFACLLWRQDNLKQFTCGSLILNKAVIGTVYMEIFNYILILVQFRMTQEMGDQIEKQKNTIQDWIGVDYV